VKPRFDRDDENQQKIHLNYRDASARHSEEQYYFNYMLQVERSRLLCGAPKKSAVGATRSQSNSMNF